MSNKYGQTRSFNLGIALELGIDTALLYDELSFWSNKGSRDDGWIYKTLDELMERLPIKRMTLRRAIDKLIEAGYIEKKVMKVKGVPVMHFRLLKVLSVAQIEHLDLFSENNSIESPEMNKSIYTATNNSIDTKVSTQSQAPVRTAKLPELTYEPLPEDMPRTRTAKKPKSATTGILKVKNPPSDFGDKETNAILRKAKTYGMPNSSLDRHCAYRLKRSYGYSEVIALLDYSQSIRRELYAPQITTLTELEKKWGRLSDHKLGSKGEKSDKGEFGRFF